MPTINDEIKTWVCSIKLHIPVIDTRLFYTLHFLWDTLYRNRTQLPNIQSSNNTIYWGHFRYKRHIIIQFSFSNHQSFCQTAIEQAWVNHVSLCQHLPNQTPHNVGGTCVSIMDLEIYCTFTKENKTQQVLQVVSEIIGGSSWPR